MQKRNPRSINYLYSKLILPKDQPWYIHRQKASEDIFCDQSAAQLANHFFRKRIEMTNDKSMCRYAWTRDQFSLKFIEDLPLGAFVTHNLQ